MIWNLFSYHTPWSVWYLLKVLKTDSPRQNILSPKSCLMYNSRYHTDQWVWYEKRFHIIWGQQSISHKSKAQVWYGLLPENDMKPFSHLTQVEQCGIWITPRDWCRVWYEKSIKSISHSNIIPYHTLISYQPLQKKLLEDMNNFNSLIWQLEWCKYSWHLPSIMNSYDPYLRNNS